MRRHPPTDWCWCLSLALGGIIRLLKLNSIYFNDKTWKKLIRQCSLLHFSGISGSNYLKLHNVTDFIRGSEAEATKDGHFLMESSF